MGTRNLKRIGLWIMLGALLAFVSSIAWAQTAKLDWGRVREVVDLK